jgi:hypothetical protein
MSESTFMGVPREKLTGVPALTLINAITVWSVWNFVPMTFLKFVRTTNKSSLSKSE